MDDPYDVFSSAGSTRGKKRRTKAPVRMPDKVICIIKGRPAIGMAFKLLKLIQQESYRVSVALLLLRMVHWGYGVCLKYTDAPLTRN